MSNRWTVALVLGAISLFVYAPMASAQDGAGGKAAVDIFLDDEELDVEADIPSVDLILNFKGIRYEGLDPKKSFLKELLETVEDAPF